MGKLLLLAIEENISEEELKELRDLIGNVYNGEYIMSSKFKHTIEVDNGKRN